MKPRLSVIVASYNTGKYVEATMDSIFGQDFTDFECIVVDGASTDDTLEKLKKYPQAKVISQKDRGYFDAITNGLNMAQGDYFMQCCISDGYLDMGWFRKCVEAMDADKEVSVVWGFPQYMRENGELLAVSYPQFHKELPPQKEEFFYYWLASSFWFPDGNFCVRTDVARKCFPPYTPEGFNTYEAWLEMNFRLEKEGYMPLFLPTVANYGRIHDGQAGEREGLLGATEKKFQHYVKEVRALRRQVVWGGVKHVFKDGAGNVAPYTFSRWHFISSQLLSPSRAVQNIKRLFLNVGRTTIFILESKKSMPRFLSKKIAAKRRAKAGM